MRVIRCCEHCRFWNEVELPADWGGSRIGDCRIHAPVVAATAEEDLSGFPRTKPSEWCGEFKPKEGTG
jgi:hypothetical protein